MTLAGPVRARLVADAGADGAAQWTVTLCVEREDGAWHNLCEGVARGAGPVEVDLGAVCVDVAAGERLVVLVAGSSFPRWPRPAAAGQRDLAVGIRPFDRARRADRSASAGARSGTGRRYRRIG